MNDNPRRPDVKAGPEDGYWDHVDFIVAEANKRGMYIGFLPTWGDVGHVCALVESMIGLTLHRHQGRPIPWPLPD